MSTHTPHSQLATYAVLVIDPQAVQLVAPLCEDDALSLMECLSEDPADWQDLMLVWPRYRFDLEQPEFASAFPRRALTWDEAESACAEYAGWVALDLVQKRVLTSPAFPSIEWIWRGASGREVGLRQSEQETPPDFFCVIPGWWELTTAASERDVRKARLRPLAKPHAARDVLWGSPLFRAFAQALLTRAQSNRAWLELADDEFADVAHQSSVAVHREWLLTPREDLAGWTPRDCLHGGMQWIESLINGQMLHLQNEQALTPVPPEFSGYETAPPGTHEVIMYFHACREILAAGWDWIRRHAETLTDVESVDAMPGELAGRLASWLEEPFEGGPSPAEIIACERGRIPLIEAEDSHNGDCDCPICQMMAEGMFGPSVTGYDGHELELEDDFAFSLCTTRGEWEEQRLDWGEHDSSQLGDGEACCASTDGGDESLDKLDGLESPWQNTVVSDEGLPGDPQGHLAMAFFLAEVVAALKQLGAAQADIDRLNRTFRDFRTAETPEAFSAAGIAWLETLEMLALHYPDLVGRSADLQSRVVENLRVAARGNAGESGNA